MAASIIVVVALAAVNEVVLPMTFAAVLAVIFKPLVGVLTCHRLKSSIAADLVVLRLLGLVAGVTVATVQGAVDQVSQIGDSDDAATEQAAAALGIEQASLYALRAAAAEATPTIQGGLLTRLVSDVSTLVVLASGLILGALIRYYLLKDGSSPRRSVVAWIDPRLQGCRQLHRRLVPDSARLWPWTYQFPQSSRW